MYPWVGPQAPSFGRQLWGLPSRVEYLSPQGVLLPLVYGTTASPLWFELRGHSAWPQPARDHNDSTARTRNTHTTRRDAQTPNQHNTHPCPPHHQQ